MLMAPPQRLLVRMEACAFVVTQRWMAGVDAPLSGLGTAARRRRRRRRRFLAWPSAVVVSSQTPAVILALYFFLKTQPRINQNYLGKHKFSLSFYDGVNHLFSVVF